MDSRRAPLRVFLAHPLDQITQAVIDLRAPCPLPGFPAPESFEARAMPNTLDDASLDELRCEWRRLYRGEPPRTSRDLLIRGVGYRLQEIQHGGLGKSTRRKLKLLAENRVNREVGAHAKHPSLLAGMVFDENGERLTPTHAVKKGTRYRYYVSRSLIIGTAKDRSKGRRIPAGNLESLVITRLRTFLSDQGAILDAISDEHADGAGQNRLIGRGRQIAKELGDLAPDQTRAMIMTLLSRVDIRPGRVEISIRRGRLVELLDAQPFEATTQGGKSDEESEELLKLTVMARLAARRPRDANAGSERG